MELYSTYEWLYPDKGRGEMATLCDITLLNSYEGIKGSLEKQALSQVMLELYLRHIYGPESSIPLYEILTSSLSSLDYSTRPATEFPLFLCEILLQFCGVTGIRPQFHQYVPDNEPVSGTMIRFDLESGGPVRANGGANSSFLFTALSSSVFVWLHQLQNYGERAGVLEPRQMRQAEDLLLAFVSHHSTGRSPLKSLSFYRGMIMPTSG